MRFSDETEHRQAMIEMQGAVGCGSKPLRVSAATPKRYPDFISKYAYLNFIPSFPNKFSYVQWNECDAIFIPLRIGHT